MNKIKALPKGTALARFAKAIAATRNMDEAIDVSAQWSTTPAARLTLKAASESGAVASGNWGAALASYGLSDEFYELFRDASIVGRLSSRMARVPFNIATPTETSGGSQAQWVGEGISKPVGAFVFSTTTLESFKATLIIVISQALARHSTPSAEATVSRILTNSTAAFIDSEFLSSDAAIAGTSPGGIGAGQQTQASSGATAALIAADVSAMGGKLGSWGDPVFITRPKSFMHMAALGLITFLADGTALLSGMPIFWTSNSPAQLLLLDLAGVMLADDEESSISRATQATILMDDGTSPTVTTEVSLWQNNLSALKVERFVSWDAATTATAVVMPVSY